MLSEDFHRTGLSLPLLIFFLSFTLSVILQSGEEGPTPNSKTPKNREVLFRVDKPSWGSSWPLAPLPCKLLAAWEPVNVLVSPCTSALDPAFNQSPLSCNIKKESVSSVALKQSK